MDTAAFESRLKSEGYTEIRTNSLEAKKHNPEHSHPWDVLALVLDGDITLTIDGKPTKYGTGQQFTMQAGCLHVEDAGPQGVRYLVGRRPK
jgi:quercetin dioxygenase-like cupin family protein